LYSIPLKKRFQFLKIPAHPAAVYATEIVREKLNKDCAADDYLASRFFVKYARTDLR
jgi:hypothetical protein